MSKVKICGLFRPEDIEAVNQIKPDYIGFIINFPKSHRNLSKEEAKNLATLLDKEIKAVGVFVDEPVTTVASMINEGTINIPQLHGSEDNEFIGKLRKLIPIDTPIWQAIQVKSKTDIDRANASQADFVILDAGQGAGVTFDWSCIEGIDREFGLAGGLNENNVSAALKTGASLLDISGGVETDKVKDSTKIEKVVKIVKEDR